MEIILDTSEKAAKFVENISGWVDCNGRFFGNSKNSESAARYSGCTHQACNDCGEPAEKMYTVCPPCREKRDVERYAQRELEEWDEKVPVYSPVADRFTQLGERAYRLIVLANNLKLLSTKYERLAKYD